MVMRCCICKAERGFSEIALHCCQSTDLLHLEADAWDKISIPLPWNQTQVLQKSPASHTVWVICFVTAKPATACDAFCGTAKLKYINATKGAVADVWHRHTKGVLGSTCK